MKTPVVFVTAYSARYDKPSLIDAGGDDVVTKPVDYTRRLLVSSRLLVRSPQPAH
jgi:DNA-binding response OmpR family regulator